MDNVDQSKKSFDREEKSKEIALNPNQQILRLNDYTYKVKWYTPIQNATCSAHFMRGGEMRD